MKDIPPNHAKSYFELRVSNFVELKKNITFYLTKKNITGECYSTSLTPPDSSSFDEPPS